MDNQENVKKLKLPQLVFVNVWNKQLHIWLDVWIHVANKIWFAKY